VNLGGEEGQAAGLRLAEMHLTAPAFEPAWGLTDLTGALVKVHSPHDYKNKLVTLIHVREIFETVWSLFQEKHDFTHAEQLAELYKKVALRGVAEERLAQSLQARGEELEDKASKGSGPLVNSWKEQAREQFLKAGAAFESAANARPIIQQAATLEQIAACFSRAKDFTKAVAAWKRFVQIHNSDEALAGGCMALADAYRALGQMDLAREALYKCIEYPNTPFAFRARYQLALEAIDQGKLDQAEKILEQNVREVNGPVDREAHGKSLYQYAGLLLQRKNYDKAPLFLDLATREYPDDPKAWSARDQLGLCYRQLAKEEDRKLQEKGVEEKNAAYRSEKRRGYLGNAAKVYQKLADDLEKLSTLSAKQQSLLGKSQVAVADIYRAMAEYGEAIRRYKILLEKYHGKKEELLACAGIWYSAKELYTADQTRRDALEDTRVALAKTLADLDNMTPDSEAFQGPDGRSREIWLNWLRNAQRDINDQIQNPVPPPAQTTTPP
jgi:tetratricopeptide (TPR) repeat protein